MEAAASILRDSLSSESNLITGRVRGAMARGTRKVAGMQNDVVVMVVGIAMFALLTLPPLQWALNLATRKHFPIRKQGGGITAAGYFVNLVIFVAAVAGALGIGRACKKARRTEAVREIVSAGNVRRASLPDVRMSSSGPDAQSRRRSGPRRRRGAPPGDRSSEADLNGPREEDYALTATVVEGERAHS